MLLCSTLGQHVGETSADTYTGVVGDATRDGRTVAERNRAAFRIALTRRRPEPGRDATGRGNRRETSTDVGVGAAGERTGGRRAVRHCPRRGLDVTEVKASPDGKRRAGVSRDASHQSDERNTHEQLLHREFSFFSVSAMASAGRGDAAV